MSSHRYCRAHPPLGSSEIVHQSHYPSVYAVSALDHAARELASQQMQAMDHDRPSDRPVDLHYHEGAAVALLRLVHSCIRTQTIAAIDVLCRDWEGVW